MRRPSARSPLNRMRSADAVEHDRRLAGPIGVLERPALRPADAEGFEVLAASPLGCRSAHGACPPGPAGRPSTLAARPSAPGGRGGRRCIAQRGGHRARRRPRAGEQFLEERRPVRERRVPRRGSARRTASITRSASKPSGHGTTFHRLRSSSAEPPSSASVSAICIVTSANRTRGLRPAMRCPSTAAPAPTGAEDGDRRPHADRHTRDHDQKGGDDEHANVNRRVRDAEDVCRRHRDERPQERERRKEPDTARRERRAAGFRRARGERVEPCRRRRRLGSRIPAGARPRARA